MALSKEEILDAISEMSVIDIVDLISAMEEKFGVSAAAPVAAAALKNLRLEGVFEPFNDFLSLIICISSYS